MCFDGKLFVEYFFDYVGSIYNNVKMVGKKIKLFIYIYLNIGYEVIGICIR